MRYELREVTHVLLKPYVKYLVISESADVAQTYQVLPGTSLVIGFQYQGRLGYIEDGRENALASSGITGLLDGYRTFKNAPATGSVLVVFTETGAAQFLRIPLHDLFQRSISLEHFFSRRQIGETEERLMAAGDDKERLSIVEQFLVDNLNTRVQDNLVTGALQVIHQSQGTIRITKLAQMLNTSQSPLEKRFRAVVGASPKKFAGIVRSGHVLMAIEQNNAKVAEHLLSYYDQAHFIKDFKRFTSFTPEQYVKLVKRRGQVK